MTIEDQHTDLKSLRTVIVKTADWAFGSNRIQSNQFSTLIEPNNTPMYWKSAISPWCLGWSRLANEPNPSQKKWLADHQR